jgi:hypothetical protein
MLATRPRSHRTNQWATPLEAVQRHLDEHARGESQSTTRNSGWIGLKRADARHQRATVAGVLHRAHLD